MCILAFSKTKKNLTPKTIRKKIDFSLDG